MSRVLSFKSLCNKAIENQKNKQNLEISKNKLEKAKSVASDFAAVLLLATLSFGFASMAYDQSEKAQQRAEVRQ